jgi:hypothetical protein
MIRRALHSPQGSVGSQKDRTPVSQNLSPYICSCLTAVQGALSGGHLSSRHA